MGFPIWAKPLVGLHAIQISLHFEIVAQQELGGNYYQPMIEYINSKNIQGPFFDRKPVQMPQGAEVVSNKYSNM